MVKISFLCKMLITRCRYKTPEWVLLIRIKMLFLQQFNKIAVMDTIQIKDKRFTPFIPEERILKEVARVASEINRDLEGTNPLFLSVLNGAFMFAAT